MRQRKSGVGAELAPLILILACLAGSFGSIIAVYRRVNVARTLPPKPTVVAVAPPPPEPKPAPRAPTPRPPKAKSAPPPSPLPPEDPTPKLLAPLLAAEAEQLLEASKANREAQTLETARQAAEAESERWRRRQSLIHAQINSLESKVRKVEVDLDQMALERDALERELDARKAAVARAKSRPEQAILPHKGPNGTWRRPIVVECRNGAAIIQPQGLEFGILDLESGFGPTANRFVNAIAREAIRVQRLASPDGALVVPYIFFLVRPDGIRPYYEARGRLEPLGITFGYELADADWEIEFPNLDDVATWDGSAPSTGTNPVLAGAGTPSSARNAEDTDLPVWPGSRPDGPGAGGSNASNAFTFGPVAVPGGGNSRFASFLGRPLTPSTTAGSGRTGAPGTSSGTGTGTGNGTGLDVGSAAGVGSATEPGGKPGSGPGLDSTPTLTKGPGGKPGGAGGPRVTASGRILPPKSGGRLAGGPGPNGSGDLSPAGPGGGAGPQSADGPSSAGTKPGFELALDGPTADAPGGSRGGESGTQPGPGDVAETKPPAELELTGPTSDPTAPASGKPATPDPADPANRFVWSGTAQPHEPAHGTAGDDAEPTLNFPRASADDPTLGADETNPAPRSIGRNGTGAGAGRSERPNPGASGGSQAARRMLGQSAASNPPAQTTPGTPPPDVPGALGLGLPTPPRPLESPSTMPDLSATPPSLNQVPPLPVDLTIPPHPPLPSEISDAVQRQTSPRSMPVLPSLDRPGSIVDRTFEIVVVCTPKGVIVQPGAYRITADALQERDGLFKKQIVALVKFRRAADPKVVVEPRIRFLVQPRGYETYRLARSQFFVSGLNWPTTTELGNPDPLAITTSGVR